MKSRLLHQLKHRWIETVLLPFFIVPLCYFLYDDAYFRSWQSFVAKTLPWFMMAALTSTVADSVRLHMVQRYPRLEDWKRRVALSFSAYIFNVLFFAQLTYFLLTLSHYEGLVPANSKYYILIIFAIMSVLIVGTMYEVVTFFEQWKQAQSESEKLEKLNFEMQFQSLQSQLNPHFLFNSLNALSSLITENPRRAEEFVDELSNVYRYLLRSNQQEFATVQEELRFTRSYFHLLKTRHENSISLLVDVSQEVLSLKIPAMSLQILLENAVKHNEASTEQPLDIHIFDENGRLIIRNKIQEKVRKPDSNKVGLDNLRQRYTLMGAEGFEARAVDGYFEVRLPIMP